MRSLVADFSLLSLFHYYISRLSVGSTLLSLIIHGGRLLGAESCT